MDGITLATYRDWKCDPSLNGDDLRDITQSDVFSIYRQSYWKVVHGDALNNGVDLMVFDMEVNAGAHSAMILQATIGVSVDGDIGPITLAAANAADPQTLINELATNQIAFYRSLSTFYEFGRGWLNRVSARHETAIAMTKRTSQTMAKVTVFPPEDFYSNLKSFV